MALTTQAHFHAAGTSDHGKPIFELAKMRIHAATGAMPPVTSPQLSSDELAALDGWLEQGAQGRLVVEALLPGEGQRRVHQFAERAGDQRDADLAVPQVEHAGVATLVVVQQHRQVRGQQAQHATALEHAVAVAQVLARLREVELADEVLGLQEVGAAVGERQRLRKVGDHVGLPPGVGIDVQPAGNLTVRARFRLDDPALEVIADRARAATLERIRAGFGRN